MSNPKEPTKEQKIILHGLSALIPFLILGLAFALHNVHPFGDRQILVTDFWHQYYPFLSDHWHRLREGGSFLWSWQAGGGHDYLAHFAYYLASPLNFLIALFPREHLREVVTVFLLVKVGFSGLFMSLFLSKTMKKYDVLLPIFSTFYALCAFTLGYYWNIMWFDTIALMPLVMLGVYALVREGKYRLYIAALAIAILSNFYIGLFVCILVAIMFFVQSYVAKLSRREFLQRMITIGIASLIALGIAAIILLPTYAALQNTSRAETRFPDFRFYDSFASVLGNFIAFTPATSLEGLPNLYSGLLSVLLLPVFLLSKKISIREKIAYLSLFVFLILSVNINILDFIWNGFTRTNMLPFRFSFIASFVVVIMAYKAFTLMDEITKKDLFLMGSAAVFFHLMAFLGSQESNYIGYSVVLSLIYLALFAFARSSKNMYLFKHILLFTILIELAFTSYNGIRTTTRNNFPLDYDEVQQLLDHRVISDNDFVRTELSRDRTLNSPSLYGFDGISLFSSLANVSATEFMEGIGLRGWPTGNRFTYATTSPLTNAFLNVRYMIVRNEHPMGDGQFWGAIVPGESSAIASYGNNHLFRNEYHLPFGFMVQDEIVYYEGNRHNPFIAQNDLFRLATGIDEDLFTLIDIIHVRHRDFSVRREGFGEYTFTLAEDAEDGMFRFNYEIPTNGPVYAFFNFRDTNQVRTVRSDDHVLHTVETRRSYIFSAGTFEEGAIISFEADSTTESGTGSIFVAVLNPELFAEGLELLAAETLHLTYFSDTRFRGEIVVSEPRILYTSLPYAGNWRVFVNGIEEDVVTIGGAMAGVRLPSGTHIVEFRYHNQAVNLGATISVISLAIYAILLALHRKGIDIFETMFNRIFSSEESESTANHILLGAATILFNWIVYIWITQAFGAAVIVSNFLTWILTAAFNFIAYKLWIFKNQTWEQQVLATQIKEFAIEQRLTGLIDLIGMPLLFFIGLNESLLGVEGFEAKLVISGVIVIANFALKKRVSFISKVEVAPEEVANEETDPEKAIPEEIAHEEVTHEETTPEEVTQEEIIHEEVTLEETPSEEDTAHEEVTPNEPTESL